MKYCTRCQASAANNWLFCVKCGCYIGNDAGDDEIQYRCKKCDVVFYGGEFCPYCGTNVTDGVSSLFGENRIDPSKIEVGMQISFGKYHFREFDELDPIEWIVLDKKEDSVLLLSKYALDGHRYHAPTDCTWEECEVREWLHTKFMDKAFTKEEYVQIESVPREANGKVLYEDKVFLLDDSEFGKYIEFNKEAKENKYLMNCYPTEYANLCGAKRGGNGTCQWWLRKEYTQAWFKKWVNRVGQRERSLNHVAKMGVRPAIWVYLTPRSV